MADPVRDSRIEPVTKDKPKELSMAHLDVWSGVLEATFGPSLKYCIVRSEVAWNLLRLTAPDVAHEADEAATLQRLLRFLRKVLLRYERILIPVRSGSINGGTLHLAQCAEGRLELFLVLPRLPEDDERPVH